MYVRDYMLIQVHVGISQRGTVLDNVESTSSFELSDHQWRRRRGDNDGTGETKCTRSVNCREACVTAAGSEDVRIGAMW
jgi:hypothetical protein